MCHSKTRQLNVNRSDKRTVGLRGSLVRQKGSTTIVAIIISIVLLGLGIALSNQISSNMIEILIENFLKSPKFNY